jgi:hypothetical protein
VVANQLGHITMILILAATFASAASASSLEVRPDHSELPTVCRAARVLVSQLPTNRL